MSEDPSKERGFVVVDKRGREEEPPSESPPGGSRADAPEGGAQAGAPGSAPRGERELPRPDFASLLISLGHSALYHLGLVADPQSGRRGEKNLALARETIDLVEMLEQKTRGNLTPEEAQLLEELLYDLRMRYVESAR
ncbi:MAG TPA: DUF1844 domain-containing protein [Myxococcota bacterium]|nr:DUF1844 domain-containing protein [Myxococcota bacterium]